MAFSLTSYLDTIQSERVKLNPTQEMSYSPDNETDTCQTSQYGTMYAASTEHPGEDQLMFFAEDSPAKTSVRRVKAQELAESVQSYGRSMRDSLARCNLDLSLPKTHLCFALGDLELSSKTWPRWGIMLDGELSELGLSVRPIKETGCGFLLPTPDASDRGPCKTFNPKAKSQSGRTLQTLASCDPMGKIWPTPTCQETEHPDATLTQTGRRLSKNGKTSHSLNLADTVKRWPAPRSCSAMAATITPESAHNPKRFPNLETVVGQATWPAPSGTQTPQVYLTPQANEDAAGTPAGKMQKMLGNSEVVRGKTPEEWKKGTLNPSWVEWLMGWPIRWTDLKPLVTDKFRNVQPWHSTFSQKD